MATNKNAQLRYLTLDRCFGKLTQNFTIDKLVEACNNALLELNPESTGVKKRQVYEDIKFMRDSLSYDAPIETKKDGRYTYYFYEDRDFTIKKQLLTDQETQQMKETLMTLSRFKGMPQFDWMDEMVTRLKQSLLLTSEEKVISFDENEELTGRKYIGELYQAIVSKQSLTIGYQKYTDDAPTEQVIHPYHLKQYNKRWFLFALNDEYQNISNYPLDRIKSIAKSKVSYIENKEIDFDKYFYYVIGVTIDLDAKLETVELKVDNSLLPYIVTKPIHPDQDVIHYDDYAIVKLKLQINYELKSLILSHGKKVEVMKPLELREEIAAIAKQMTTNYLTCAE